jgi:deoxycytidylate deaminase
MRAKHGAVLTKNGNVVAVATNRLRNCPRTIKHAGADNYSYHAERLAIRRAQANNVDLDGAVIYVARSMGRGSGLSRPCNRCYDAIVDAGIKKIVYTN